jgi:8-oxo-dGTP pyrophosphatase MutT (NUDIX family)
MSETGRDLPGEGEVIDIEAFDLRVVDGVHPVERENRAAIGENWEREKAAKPALFNGRVVFQDRVAIKDRMLRAEGFVVDYATFLWWRRHAEPKAGFHLFGFPVPVSSDGALIAVKMSEHTLNGGYVYCPAGGIDDSDVVDGRCDLAGNMAREVLEETGLRLDEARAADGLHVFRFGRHFTVFRYFHFDRTADSLIDDIRGHIADGHEDEIADAVAITSGRPDAHRYSRAMLPILHHYFGSDRG